MLGNSSRLGWQLNEIVKPLLSIVYTEDGEYYAYQAKDLLDVDCLGQNFTKRSKKDKFFVTKAIADIAGLAF